MPDIRIDTTGLAITTFQITPGTQPVMDGNHGANRLASMHRFRSLSPTTAPSMSIRRMPALSMVTAPR